MRNKTAAKGWLTAAGLAAGLWLTAAVAQGVELKEVRLDLEKAKLSLSGQRYQEAVDLLEIVVAAEPENTEALHYLGLAQIGRGDFKAAEQVLARALKKDASLISCRLDRAWALIELKRPEDALAEIETVSAKEPENSRAFYLQGQALLLMKKFAEAAAAFEKAAALDPKLAQESLVYAGISRDRAGEADKARENLLSAQALDPSSPMGKTAGDYLDRLEGKAKPEKGKRVEGSLALCYQFDTNVAATADDRMLPKGMEDTEDYRGVVLAGVLVRPLITDYWSTEVRYDFYGSEHQTEEDYNLLVHQGTLGGDYKTKLGRFPLQLRIRALYQWAGLGEDYAYYSSTWRALPSAFLQESEHFLTEFSYAVESEQFDQPGVGDENRDNLADQVFLAQHLGFPDNRGSLKLGARFTFEDAIGKEWDVNRPAGVVELRLRLWKKARAQAGFEYEFRDYFNNRAGRQDEIFIYTARLEQEIIRHLTVYLSANVSDYNSTLSGFNYDRNIYSVGLIGWL